MQFDRMFMRQAVRLAPKLLAQATKKRPAAKADEGPNVSLKRAEPDLRGSGSWANEWAGAKSAIARTRVRSEQPKPTEPTQAEEAAPIAEGSITQRPIMTARENKLYTWIADRLETDAPTCSLHVGVALNAFMRSEVPGALDGLHADMAIIDETGHVLAVLIRDRRDDPARQIRLIDALIDSEMPTIDLPDRLSLSKLWSQISDVLPG